MNLWLIMPYFWLIGWFTIKAHLWKPARAWWNLQCWVWISL